jgi:hypothetical protein
MRNVSGHDLKPNKMSLRKLFNKFLSKESEKEISKEDIQALAEMIKRERSQMNEWDKMFGILCFNIWHNSSQDFQRSQDIQDIEIPFLCAIGVFQNLNNMTFSKIFDNKKLSKLAPQNVQNSSKALIKQLPSIKETLNRITNTNNIEVIKPFTTVFAQGFLNDYKKNYSGDNPMDYFQKGIEVLYLFMDEIRETDNSFYLELSNYGEYSTDIDLIIEDINTAVK